MPLKIAKVGLTLALTLTIVYSSNLEPKEAQNEPTECEGYYYVPPHQFKNFNDLTVFEQKKAQELGFDRASFAKYILQSNPNTPKWADFEANTTK